MSRKGENIYKRKDGRWESRYIKGYDADGHAKYASLYSKTYREAKEKLNTAKTDLMQGNFPTSNSRKRFGSYCDEWLYLSKPRLKESTYEKYEYSLKKHIKPLLGGYKVLAMTTSLVGRFGQQMLNDGLSPKTVHDLLSIVHTVLEYVQTQEPGMRNVKVMYPKQERQEMRVLSREEQQKLTSYLLSDMDSCKFGVLLTLLTGLRIGEVCALRWGDISFSSRTLNVCCTLQRLKNYDHSTSGRTKVVLSSPKTSTSARAIPLTDYAVQLCRCFAVSDRDAFVLTGRSDRFVEPRTLQYKLGRYAKECGIEGLHFHALRHTFATRCVEVGFEIKSLSEILGHTSPKFTLERYVHSSMELKRDNMEKLSAVGC